MFARIAGELAQVPEFIQQRQLALFLRVDPAYGAGVEAALRALKG